METIQECALADKFCYSDTDSITCASLTDSINLFSKRNMFKAWLAKNIFFDKALFLNYQKKIYHLKITVTPLISDISQYTTDRDNLRPHS